MRRTTSQVDPATPTPEEFSAWINPAPLVYESVDQSPWRRHALDRLDLGMAVVLFIVAIAARWPLIERGETLLHSDEAIVGLMAQDISEGTRFPIYFYGQRYMGALEAYVIAAITPFLENPIHALRVGPVLFFAALVAAQYLMLATWFGRRGGVIGAGTLIFAAPMFAQWSISARGGYIEILLWGTLLLWAYGAWFVAYERPRTGMRDKGTGKWEDGSRTEESKVAPVSPPRRPISLLASLLPHPSSFSPIRSAHPPARVFEAATLHRLAFGAIIGSGFWINPSIVLFVVPILGHYLLTHLPDGESRAGRSIRALLDRLGILALPVVALASVVVLTSLWSVHVDHGRVRSLVLLGLLPTSEAKLVIVIGLAGVMWIACRRMDVIGMIRRQVHAGGIVLLGILVGAAPAIMYLLQVTLGVREMDPSLPLGLRPLWSVGQTMSYMWYGLPLLLGADARPFLELVTIGRPSPFVPLDILVDGIVRGANLLALGAAITAALSFLLSYRHELGCLLRLKSGVHPPVILLLLGAMGVVGLFLFSGAAHDFNTIRYLIPGWAFMPGLLAAAAIGPLHKAIKRIPAVVARPLPDQFGQPSGAKPGASTRVWRIGMFASVSLLAAWAMGQVAMYRQLGSPHPLRPVADALVKAQVEHAVAEIFDAHLLSYLTNQQCRVAEHDPFWSRLSHYTPAIAADSSIAYIVLAEDRPEYRGSTSWHHPGAPPPEVHRVLWARLLEAIDKSPERLLARRPLGCGYELIRVRKPDM